MWNYQPSYNPWEILPPYMHPCQMLNMFGPNNFGPMRPWETVCFQVSVKFTMHSQDAHSNG